MSELTFDQTEGVFNLGPDLHLNALDLVDQLAMRAVLVEFLAQARRHRYVPLHFRLGFWPFGGALVAASPKASSSSPCST